MTNKNKKLNIFNKEPAQYRRQKPSGSGFVILFAVVISSIILSITLGVANIAFREAKFGTSAKEANYSFFAADSGIECALFNDRPPTAFPLPGDGDPGAVACASATPTFVGNSDSGVYTFFVVGLGTTAKNCSKITVSKTRVGTDILTTTIAKGYNTGGDNVECSSASSSRIEREIKVTY